MDEYSQDQILLDELMRNERLVEHPTYGTVKLQRPTPRKEAQIAEVRRRQYHQDIQDKSVLSKARLEELAIENGAWSLEKKERMENLRTVVGQLMMLLETLGYESPEETAVRFSVAVDKLLQAFQEQPQMAEVILRYFDLEEEPKNEDERAIRNASTSTEMDDLLKDAQNLRAQMELLDRLGETRKELTELQVEYVRIIKDSKEARADRAEKLATLYYCATRPDGAPLWPTFDEIWDSNPRDIEILDEELYFFTRGVTDFERVMIGKHGFTVRVPQKEPSEPSDDSLGHPQPNSNGESPESVPTSSSVSTDSAISTSHSIDSSGSSSTG